MRVENVRTHEQDVEQGRWRFLFLKSLWQCHQWLPHTTETWARLDADYRVRLANAQAELARLSALDAARGVAGEFQLEATGKLQREEFGY